MGMADLTGLHHVTAITGDAAGNVAFYRGVLGMRLVKRTVNQDDVSAYHLFYADAKGSPGTDLTFFDWPAASPNRAGVPSIGPIGLRVPGEGSLEWWSQRLTRSGVSHQRIEGPDGPRIALADPEGQRLELVTEGGPAASEPWTTGPVPVEHRIMGLRDAGITSGRPDVTAEVLTGLMGFTLGGERTLPEGREYSFDLNGEAGRSSIRLLVPAAAVHGRQGRGGVHHVAFRVPDQVAQEEVRATLLAAGVQATPVIDRFYFRSVYFREPGGNLFEIATDGPGFTADESEAELGERLALPPFLEPRRAEIEAGLAPLNV